MMSGWLAFWDRPNSIYVNARHKDVHYRLLAQQIAARVPSPQARVLDYGSGEALNADRVAAVAGELLPKDAAPSVRAGLTARFAANPKIRVLGPEQISLLPEHSLDLIVLHSVSQYISREEAGELFALFARLLKRDGTLIVSDVIPPHVAAFTDAAALLRFAAQNGFLGAAIAGLLRTLASDYTLMRSRIGITRYSDSDMIAKLEAAGFSAQRTSTIIGFNRSRMAFVARPR
jgi:SAM-dependent methyltransferase